MQHRSDSRGQSRARGVLLAGVTAGAVAVCTEARGQGPNAVTLFVGRMADNSWEEIAARDDVGFRDAWLAGVALGREVAGGAAWALEVEGQLIRHFGEQVHGELDGALIGRWRAFPWSAQVPTSVAFGLGPSLASAVPPAEVARRGDSARLLLYWTVELEVGFRDTSLSAVSRLHHRSTGYGAFAEAGGSNFITLGIRRRF